MPTQNKSTSRAARKRMAESNQFRILPPVVNTSLDFTGVAESYQRKIDKFVPKNVPLSTWVIIRQHFLVLAAHFYRGTPSKHSAMTHISGFLAWFLHSPLRQDRSVPLDLVEILIAPNDPITAYVSTLTNTAESSKRTIRWVLRKAIAGLTPTNADLVLSRTTIPNAPYSRAELGNLLRCCLAQPTDTRKCYALWFYALGVGAGLDSYDLISLTPGDVQVHGNGLIVHVPEGRRFARAVPVLHQMAPYVKTAKELHLVTGKTEHDPIFASKPGYNNAANYALSKVTFADGSRIGLNPTRLRATWLLTMLSIPLPVSEFLYLAGLKNTAPVTKLLDFLPASDHLDFTQLVAHAALVTAGGEQQC